LNSILQVCIIKDNGWALATQFKCHSLEIALSGQYLDRLSGRYASGKADFRNLHMGGKKCSRASIACQDLEDTRRKASLKDQSSQLGRHKWRLFARFQYENIPSGQGRRSLEAHRCEWAIPRNDPSHHTEGFIPDNFVETVICRKRLSCELVDPASIVCQSKE
jgi:hypothetical protein